MKILVIAPESLVGSRFVECFGAENVVGAGNTDPGNLAGFYQLDITDPKMVEAVITDAKIRFELKYLINFAALTNVGEIEKSRPEVLDQSSLEQNLAYRVHVIGTRNILKAADANQITPIFISTDFVFDGSSGPYAEDAEICLDLHRLSFYGYTKALAEKELSGQYINLRISYPYRQDFSKGDFCRNFLKLYDDSVQGLRTMYPVFDDQIFTPTFIDDLAPAVKTIIAANSFGNFHLASPACIDFYTFCAELLRVARGVEEPELILKRGKLVAFLNEHPEAAKWPLRGGLGTDRLEQIGFVPTNWSKGIKVYADIPYFQN